MDYELKIIEEHKQERYLLLNNAGGMFHISALLYQILVRYKTSKDCEAIASEMNTLYNTIAFNRQFIDDTVVRTLHTASAAQSAAASGFDKYVYGKITIVREGRLTWAYRLLSAVFFQRILFPLLFLSASMLTILFFFNNHLLSFSTLWVRSADALSAGNLALLYSAFVLICLFHELGHAAASWHFGVKPREIGFGFYFVFPVFYTNVSDIWQLSAGKRNVVNIAGIYFQLLVNVLLILCYYQGGQPTFVFALIVSNTISIAASLIPFFRYDGYWLFSDYFQLANLRTRSGRLAMDALFAGPGKVGQVIRNVPVPLIGYALLNVVFWVCVYVQVIQMLSAGIQQFVAMWMNDRWSFAAVTWKEVLATGTTIVAVWLLVTHLIQLSKLITYEREKLSGRKKQPGGLYIA